jgi:hypothetical protein
MGTNILGFHSTTKLGFLAPPKPVFGPSGNKIRESKNKTLKKQRSYYVAQFVM